MTTEERAAIAARIRAEVDPLLDTRYNCCGCSTYHDIMEHCIRVVLGETEESTS